MIRADKAERNIQLMMRSIAQGDIANRDRLFEYSVGEFFQELSLFIEETERRNKEIEKAVAKSKK